MAKNAPSPEAIDVARRALEGLRARRCPWPSMRRMLKSEEVLRIGQGWEDLHEALDAEDENAALLAQVLPDVHNKYLTVGERYVTLYTFSRREVSQLLSPARNLAPGASAFSDSFPLPVSDASLESAPQEPVLSGIRELGRNTVGLVFCSQRSYEVRDHFPKEKMSEHSDQTREVPSFRCRCPKRGQRAHRSTVGPTGKSSHHRDRPGDGKSAPSAKDCASGVRSSRERWEPNELVSCHSLHLQRQVGRISS
jgi:hypothetical protein